MVEVESGMKEENVVEGEMAQDKRTTSFELDTNALCFERALGTFYSSP